ncbi:MAG: hypothetical protein ACKO5Q_04720 [Microcystaceae cyanobacterium]
MRRYAPDSMLYTEMVNATEIHHRTGQKKSDQELWQTMTIKADERPIFFAQYDDGFRSH